ncbi:Thiosulfate sulfurtransferase PspE precursor [compost metagenome]
MRRPFPRPTLARSVVTALFATMLGVSALGISGCAALRQRPSEPPARIMVLGVKDVTISEARNLSLQGVTVIDVREPHEYAEGHVPGARNLPLGQLDDWSQDLDSDGAYVIICRSGKRSAKAIQQLEGKGFKHLRNAQGGMLDWDAQGYPTSRP